MDRGVVALSGIDTRALTKLIREQGRMNGCITDNPDNVDFAALKAYKVQGQVAKMSTKEVYTKKAENEKFKVALLDCGARASIAQKLTERGCTVTVFPHNTPAADILAAKPNGIVLSDGPGDPTEDAGLIATVKDLAASGTPLFGIALGHQLLALAKGYKTGTLPSGHRGSNQPIRDKESGRVYITGQSHSYMVLRESLDNQAKALFEHVNDQSCEGIRYLDIPALSVQFYGGPQDTNFVFDDFIQMMEG